MKLQLTDADQNAIKARLSLATELSNTWLYFEQGAVSDSSRNEIQAISQINAFPASGFTNDTTPPALTGFNVDLNTALIPLTFTETVSATSLDVSGISVLDHPINFTTIYNLTNGTLLSEDGTEITFLMARLDIDTLKVLPNIFTRSRNSFITVDMSTIVDTSGNPVLALPPIAARQARPVVQDTQAPSLDSFNLDINTGELTLSFSESVLLFTLNTSAITLLNGQPGTSRYTLTEGSLWSSFHQ